MSDADSLQAKVALMARTFVARLPARLDAIDAALAAAVAHPAEGARWQELYRLLHSLGGAAGTFGVPAVGQEARRIELMVEQTMAAAPAGWDAANIEEVAAALRGLRALAGQ
jgi:HPt (histidine-containing phosphotransfer) domain-containing protein